jgi:glutamate decarboxylase
MPQHCKDDCVDQTLSGEDHPQTAEIEARCVHMLADLWNAPEAAKTIGCSTTGSSEAATLSGLALKRAWQARQRTDGKATKRPNIVTGPTHACWHKLARYFDIEHRQVPMERDRFVADAAEIVRYCDDNTIGVVTTLGTSFTGQYEPVSAIAGALDDLEEQCELDIPIHVDAVHGGFVAPFHEPDLIWDFRLPRVRSINTSAHGFGVSPQSVGWVIWRTADALPSDLTFDLNHDGGSLKTLSLNHSRPAGKAIRQYYSVMRRERDDFRALHGECYEIVSFMAEQIGSFAPFSMIHSGRGGVPALCWRLDDDVQAWTLFDFADRLRMRGWHVPTYSLPANCQGSVVQRLIVRNGFSESLAKLLLGDMRNALTHLDRNPVSRPLTEVEAASYNH